MDQQRTADLGFVSYELKLLEVTLFGGKEELEKSHLLTPFGDLFGFFGRLRIKEDTRLE
jgi:hypothetical protein